MLTSSSFIFVKAAGDSSLAFFITVTSQKLNNMKITFSGVGITEMTGKAQRIIIQKSYGGFQCRLLTIPNRRRTNATQNIRNNFAFVNSSWRSLTNEQRQTWIDAAPEGVSGFQFYSSFNLGLVNAGGEMITSFVAPVANPVAEGLNSWIVQAGDFGVGNEVDVSKFYYQNTVPIGDWKQAFVWTGWIPQSRYQYPRMNLALKIELQPISSSLYLLVFGDYIGGNTPPPSMSMKMMYQERWRNTVTGQVYTGDTYEVLTQNEEVPVMEYNSHSNLITNSLTGGPGTYVYEAGFVSSNSSYDISEWEPNFYYDQWYPPGTLEFGPLENVLPLTAFDFTEPTNMTIKFSSMPGDGPAPAEPLALFPMAIVWRNTTTGELSGEQLSALIAQTSP